MHPAARNRLASLVGEARVDDAAAVVDAASEAFCGVTRARLHRLHAALDGLPELAPIRPAFTGAVAHESASVRAAALVRARHRGRLAGHVHRALVALDLHGAHQAVQALEHGRGDLERLRRVWTEDAPALAAWAADVLALIDMEMEAEPAVAKGQAVAEPVPEVVVSETARPPPPRPRSTEHDPDAQPQNGPPHAG